MNITLAAVLLITVILAAAHPFLDAATALEGGDNTQGIDVQLGREKQRQITISKLKRVKKMIDVKTVSPEQLCIAALQRVECFIPHMLPHHSYLLETMCGTAFWGPLSISQRTTVGRFVAYVVAKGDLAIRFASTGRKQTKQYQLA